MLQICHHFHRFELPDRSGKSIAESRLSCNHRGTRPPRIISAECRPAVPLLCSSHSRKHQNKNFASFSTSPKTDRNTTLTPFRASVNYISAGLQNEVFAEEL